jgi:hypothetical protein
VKKGNLMYQIKRLNGSLPKWMQIKFKTYDEARNALRKYLRQKGLASSSTHPTMLWINSLGFAINRK